jgi:oligopeptidase B
MLSRLAWGAGFVLVLAMALAPELVIGQETTASAVAGQQTTTPAVAGQQPSAAPVAPVRPRYQILHDEDRTDNYHWLREKSNPDVLAYLEAENAYTAAGMRHTEALQATLYQEILGRIKETDAAVPYRRDGYWYYTRTVQGQNYPLFCRKRGTLDAPEEIYLDQNVLARDHKFHSLGGLDVSPDGTKLLYLEDVTGFREYTLYVKDLTAGENVDSIPNVWNGTAWASDNRTFFYVRADAAKRGYQAWRHAVGESRDRDVKVYEEDDVLNDLSLFRSRSGKYVFIAADGFTSSEWRVVPTAAPATPPVVIAERRPNVEYSVEHSGKLFYIYTNDAAKNFKVVTAPEEAPGPANWRDWAPHRDAVFVEFIDLFEDFAVVGERRQGLRRLRVVDLATRRGHDVTFPEAAYAVSPSTNAEFSTREYRFTYSSPITPPSVYDYDIRTRARVLRKRQEIPSGFDAARYEVRRRTATARDGTLVPISILMPKGTKLDGASPMLLYAYGSYGATTEPGFSSSVFSLVDRGFVYAIAHIRGGQEMGRDWYDQGKMLHKMNTFHDFIDVAEHLVTSGYTSRDRLVANGGSAGGLLMGVVANLRPDLFKAIVAEVPFVDVINTMLDETLPLTAQEWEQWGNPRDPEHYDYMRQYSPYDNIARQTYPWMLVTTSFNDSQVMYWEPAKWVAKLRAMKTDTNPLYFKTNLAGGHGGSSGRYDRLKETAFRYAFMLDAVGALNPERRPGR